MAAVSNYRSARVGSNGCGFFCVVGFTPGVEPIYTYGCRLYTMGGASYEVADGCGQHDLHIAFFSLQGFQQYFLVNIGQFSGAFEWAYGSNKRTWASKGGCLSVLSWWIVCMFTCVA